MNYNIRETRYELIRIVAMILIIIHHIFVHCINDQICNPDIGETSGLFNDFTVYKRLVITDYAYAAGKIGNVLFLMISGFFLINKKFDISKQIIKIVSEMFFVTLFLMLIEVVHVRFELIKPMIELRQFNGGWWFAGYYISVIFIAWIGLNDYIKKIDRKKYECILLILFAIISIGYIRGILSKFGVDGIASGVFVYLLGGYIFLYDPLKNVKSILLFAILVVFVLLMGLAYYLYTINSINSALLSNQETYNQLINGYAEYSLPCLVIGAIIFELIRRWKIRQSAFVNYVASSSFIIYMLHDNGYFYQFLYRIKWDELIYRREYLKLGAMLVFFVMIIFAVGVMAYSLHNIVIRGVTKFMHQHHKIQKS